SRLRVTQATLVLPGVIPAVLTQLSDQPGHRRALLVHCQARREHLVPPAGGRGTAALARPSGKVCRPASLAYTGSTTNKTWGKFAGEAMASHSAGHAGLCACTGAGRARATPIQRRTPGAAGGRHRRPLGNARCR